MATGVIEVVIGPIIEMLAKAVVLKVVDWATFLLNFRKEFEGLQSELAKLKGYLQHELGLQNECTKKWLLDVQNMAYDAEDMIEEFAVWGHKYCFKIKMAKRIKELKKKMKLVMEDAKRPGITLNPFRPNGIEDQKKSSIIESGAKPVAIDAKVEQILNLLEEDALQIIAVVGMGGIGKTFLMQNVYNYHKVQERFEKVIWLSISQNFSVKSLQSDIASHLNLFLGGITNTRATEMIHKKLMEESSLIVLDDVWSVEGVKDVSDLLQKLGIPHGTNNPCKVVFTSRSTEVCKGASKIYHMDLLSEQESWNLFCLHAFADDQHNRPSEELEDIAQQVERKCGRLPLAIKTLAGSMAGDKLFSNWESKLQQLIKGVSDAQDSIMAILHLSYDALPAVIKPCFLYFSFFSQNVEIEAEYLIYLWIAENFIPGNEQKQWSTGWSHLKLLNNLCLIKLVEDRNLKQYCKIHDLMLDLAISICRETKWAYTVEEASAIGCRRIIWAKKGLDDASIRRFECPPSLRTLSLSQNSIENLSKKFLSHVRALRVIDFSHTRISKLPKCIGNLKLLRVLNLSMIDFREVPDCVRNLSSLRFLDVRTCPLPEWIGDLKFLQHLHVDRVDQSSRGISELVSLRTLRSDEYGLELVLKDVAELIHLREIGILIVSEEEQSSLEGGVLEQLVNMRHLTICNDCIEIGSFPVKMKAMKDLEYLVLSWFSVPTWICEYRNLKVLKLQRCSWSEYPALDTMPNLINLEIERLNGELPESFGDSGAFPQLRYLQISYSGELKMWPDLQHGAMPRLEEFKMFAAMPRLEEFPMFYDDWAENMFTADMAEDMFAYDYPAEQEVHGPLVGTVRKIPEGFQHLKSLKLLHLRGSVPDEERERIKEGGEYWSKIKANNPRITIKCKL